MTKLLVLSDSHGARDAIKRILNKEQNNVDAVIFLGDGLRDLEQALAFFQKRQAAKYGLDASEADFEAKIHPA